jgi:hypothetical protein
MLRNFRWKPALGGALLVGLAGSAFAADHLDSPAAQGEPTADITDVYAWMSSDATKLNLVLNVAPDAGDAMSFPTSTVYAFHVNSSAGYGMAQTETLVRCQFYDEDAIECWAGDEYVVGDPSDPEGLTSASGALRVFAGLRNDPFYFEFVGFSETLSIVRGAAAGLTFDADGCPALDEATSNVLVGQLQSGADASDTFAGQNVLSLVVQLDDELVTGGGDVLGVWASTHVAE